MQHYSGSTVSAPSRCALITGKHMGHAAIRGNAKVAGSDGLLYETPLPAGEVTVADIFKTKNYVTGCVGNWGMGGPGTEGMPGKHSFDYFYGYLGQRLSLIHICITMPEASSFQLAVNRLAIFF